MRHHAPTNRSAFTLTEVLVATAILTVLSGILVTTFFYTYRSYAHESSTGQLQLSAKAALARIVRTTQQAVSVVESYENYTTDENTLIIRVPTVKQLTPSGYETLCPSPLPNNTANPQITPTAEDVDNFNTVPGALNNFLAAKALAYSSDCFSYIPNIYDYIVYQRDDAVPEKLREIVFADALSYRRSNSRTITNNVSNFSLEYFSFSGDEVGESFDQSKRIRVTLGSEETHFGRTTGLSYTEQITLRNR